MLTDFDELLQRVVLLTVYDWEFLILPLAVAVVMVTKGWPWAIPLRHTLLLFLIVYIAAYEMDRYSNWAVPMLALAMASDAVRDFWYRLLGGPMRALADIFGVATVFSRKRGDRVATLSQSRSAARIQASSPSASKPTGIARSPLVNNLRMPLLSPAVSWGIRFAVIAITFVYFDAPLELWATTGAAILLPFVVALAPGWRITAERLLRKELQHDPRLGRYLDWVRWTRARNSMDRCSILAENWICQDRRQGEPSGVQLWLARRLVPRQRMPSINSAFVCQVLLQERLEALRKFQDLYYNNSADFLTAGVLQKVSPSAILAKEDVQAALISWLSMTEALAECLAFGDERAEEPFEVRPNWLAASELLAHAGEVVQETVVDLWRESRESDQTKRTYLKEKITEHSEIASRYFDFSARCVENYLEVEGGTAAQTLNQRWGRFVGDRTNWWRLPAPLETGVPEEPMWRIVLALRYHLLTILRSLDDGASRLPPLRQVAPLSPRDINSSESTTALNAVLARDAAESCLWIARQQGDPGSRWAFDDRSIWGDRLKQAHSWRVRLLNDQKGGDLQDSTATIALGRVLHLWGLAIEQDLDVLRPGSDVWRDRLETASDYFVFEGSQRVRRLAGIAAGYNSRPADQIVELI